MQKSTICAFANNFLSWLSTLWWSFLAKIVIHIHQTLQHWIQEVVYRGAEAIYNIMCENYTSFQGLWDTLYLAEKMLWSVCPLTIDHPSIDYKTKCDLLVGHSVHKVSSRRVHRHFFFLRGTIKLLVIGCVMRNSRNLSLTIVSHCKYHTSHYRRWQS